MSRSLAWSLVAVFLAATLAAALGIPGRASYGARTTGDEPHYLVAALSLAEDADLDVRDEYAAERYRPFHEAGLAPQAKPQPDGSLVEPHEPLFSLVLAGPTALGGWTAAKAVLSLTAGALAALLLWTAVARLGVPLPRALPVVLAFALSAPFAVYGQQLYPELPAALAIAAAIAALLGPLRLAGLLVVGGAAVVLPWSTTKLAVVSAVLAGLALARLLRRGERRRAALVAVGLAVAGVAFLVAHRSLYGGWTPYAAGEHFVGGELTVVGSEPDYGGRSIRLLGLLVDREFGLAAWQPAWLLAVPAVAALLRRRPPGWAALAMPLAAGWLLATFLAATMHGWWFPGRHAVAVLPAAVLAIAWWVGQSRVGATLALPLGAAGAVTYFWLGVETWSGGITWAVDFFTTSNPWYAAWSTVLPDYTELATGDWLLHWVWLVAAFLLAALGWQSAGERAPKASTATMSARFASR